MRKTKLQNIGEEIVYYTGQRVFAMKHMDLRLESSSN